MAEGSENGGFDGGNNGGRSGGEAGGYEGGKSGGEAGGYEGGKSGGEAGGFEGGKFSGEAGGFEGGKSGGEAGGFDGGKFSGEAGGFEGGKSGGEAGGFDGEKNGDGIDTSSVDETKDTTEANDEKSDSGRTPVESEKKTETMLDNESNDYTHQTILDENLHTLSKREAGSIAPDHMAAYDKDGNVIKGDDYSNASHFEVVEDKNYSIEKTSGRSNLVQNICEQAENRNNALSVNGATVHQTYRIDVSGHENVSLQQLDALYDNLNSRLPNNVDVEFVLD